MSHGVLRDENMTRKPVQHRVFGDEAKITTEREREGKVILGRQYIPNLIKTKKCML